MGKANLHFIYPFIRSLISGILLITFLTYTHTPVYAQTIVQTPKPITGTFVSNSNNEISQYNTDDGWLLYFDDIKSAGMDTVILLAMGGFNRINVDSYGKCYGDIQEWDYFSDGTVQRFLYSAHKKNISVYLGLSHTYDPCIYAWVGTPTDPTSDQGHIIDQSLRLIAQAKSYSQTQGWGWDNNFIKGFYVSQEKDVTSFTTDAPYTAFYVNISQAVKQAYPTKQLLLSPYMMEVNSYTDIKNAISTAVQLTSFDIFAPQDSVGAGKTTSYNTDVAHYQGLRDGVDSANTLTGKNVILWGNIESFKPCVDTCSANQFAPADIEQLQWQIRAAQEEVTKSITWIHQWSFMTLPAISQTLTERRVALRNDYLTKPLIYAAFTWYIPTNLVLKGYNFGDSGDPVRVAVHYRDSSGVVHQYLTQTTVVATGNPYTEIRIPTTALPGMDLNKLLEVAVENKENAVGYYISQNPDLNPVPPFPEISPFPSPTIIPTITPAVYPGDADGNGKVDAVDMLKWLNGYISRLSGSTNGDFDGNGTVDGKDFVIWLNNFGK